ncbi:MAG: DNA gyrase/topoisomerase IV subunit B [Chloroflexota bacterium]
MAQNNNTYTSESITKLKGLEAVRKLPGMYIGNNSKYGLHHILKEIFSNAADEVMNDYGSCIRVTLHKDGSVSVWDDGRGIPVEWKADMGMSALTQVLTELHAGGKFEGGSAYASSGGLHGVGAKAANAMSTWLVASVRRGGLIFRQSFEKGGEPKTGVEIVNPGSGKVVGEITDKTKINYKKNGTISTVKEGRRKLAVEPDPGIGTGTEISFMPERKWFDAESMEWNGAPPWDLDFISLQYQQFAYLNPGLYIELVDERGKEPVTLTFHSQNGLLDYIAFLNDGLDPLHKTLYFKETSEEHEGITVEVAMQYSKDGDAAQIYSFVNGIPTPLGGTHVSGFQAGLTKAINRLSRVKKSIRGEDLLLGLAAIVNVKMSKTPQFSSQTKESLTTTEAQGAVMSVTYNELTRILEQKKSVVNTIAKQAEAAAKGREAAKKARQLVIRRSVLDAPDDTQILSKLADTDPRTPVAQRILFLVEGDSAGGSCKMARDRRYHAILANRGKIINSEKTNILRVLKNREIMAFVAALGAGVGADFKLEDRRYGRVALLTDADVDGFHIRALWYTFIFRHMRPLIDQGYLYIAEAPLYRLSNGRSEVYCYTEKERKQAQKRLGKGVSIQRYKGLGEMNPDQLRGTTLKPGDERLVRVQIEDVHRAQQYLNLLMGSNSSARKEWIMEAWEQEA